MVNFGWNITGEKADVLVKRLKEEMKLKELGEFGTMDGETPYIEKDGLYSGVRIRRLTHLPEKEQIELVVKADKIYCEVMGLPDKEKMRKV